MVENHSKPGTSPPDRRKNNINRASGLTRRDFIRRAGIAGGLLALGHFDHLAALAAVEDEPETVIPLPQRPLGSMGFNATVLGMGGIYIANGSVEEGLAILDRALELGINYYDTASQYGSGESERRYGMWLERLAQEGRRDEIFLATKTLRRSHSDAAAEIEGSLERLRSDHIDLLQVHAINDEGTLRTVMSRNGSLRAVEDAKRVGKVRHVGITGHKDPAIILQALGEYPFDSVLCPLGITDRMRRPFVDEALPELVERGVSIVAMKVFAEGNLPDAGADLERSLHYSLSLPISTAIVGMASPQEVEQNVSWVHSFEGMTEEEKQALADEVGEILDVSTLWWKN